MSVERRQFCDATPDDLTIGGNVTKHPDIHCTADQFVDTVSINRFNGHGHGSNIIETRVS
jgi:hypothetical protein